MPKIPTFSDNQVQLDAVPTFRRAALQDTRGESIGNALGNVGDVVSKIQIEEKRKADSAAVIDADTKVSAWGDNALLEAQNIKGKNAIGLGTKILPEFDKQATEQEKGIISNRAKQIFKQQTAQRRAQFSNQVGQYERRQTEQYYTDTYNSAIDQSITSAGLAAGNDKAVETELGHQEAVIRDRAASQGVDKATADLTVAEARGKTHMAVMDRLIANGDPESIAKAHDYLGKVQTQLPAEIVRRYQSAGRDLMVKGASQQATQDILVKHGDNWKAALDDAKKIKDPEVQDATVSRIKQEWTVSDKLKSDYQDQSAESGLAFITGGGKFADLPLNIKTGMKASALNSLRSFAEQGGAPKRSDPALIAQISEQLGSEEGRQQFGDTDPMTWVDRLSSGDFEQYARLQASVKTGKLDGKDSGFMTIAQIREQKAKELFPNKADIAKKGQFITDFEQRLSAVKADKARVTSEDAKKVLDDMTVEVAIKGSLWGHNTKPAYKLTPEDIAIQGRGTSTPIPKGDRDAIISALHARGLPITEEAITSIYLRGQK